MLALACAGPEATDTGKAAAAELRVVEGQLVIIIVDGEDGGEGWSETRYVLTTDDGERLNLSFLVDAPMLPSGARVRVTGTPASDGTLEVVSGADVEPLDSDAGPGLGRTRQPLENLTGQARVAVILFNFADDTRELYGLDFAHRRIFGDPTSSKAYFHEVSNGRLALRGHLNAAGDVFGWYTIDGPRQGCDEVEWGAQALAAAAADGVDTQAYERIVFAFPDYAGCGWLGIAWLRGRYAWVQGSELANHVATHEIGHTFGLQHASSVLCFDAGDRPVRWGEGERCYVSEYGDAFDVMGHSADGRLLSAYHRVWFGWLDPSAVHHARGRGEWLVDLAPIGARTGQPELLHVDPGGDDNRWHYYVEYRRPDPPFDDFAGTSQAVQGVSVRLGAELTSGYYSQRPVLLDMRPGTQSTIDAPVRVDETYALAPLRITLVSRTETSAQVRVVLSSPPVLAEPAPPAGREGEPLSFTLSATDAERDTLTFAAAGLPSGASFDTATGRFSWTPSCTGKGDYLVRFSVTDGHWTDEKSATLHVLEANCRPVLKAITDLEGVEGQWIEFTATASDPDGDSLSFELAEGPAGASLEHDAFSWLPRNGDAGHHELELVVSDGSLSARKKFFIIVAEAPELDPKVDPGPTAAVAPNEEGCASAGGSGAVFVLTSASTLALASRLRPRSSPRL